VPNDESSGKSIPAGSPRLALLTTPNGVLFYGFLITKDPKNELKNELVLNNLRTSQREKEEKYEQGPYVPYALIYS
jgi:hypothetical protein